MGTADSSADEIMYVKAFCKLKHCMNVNGILFLLSVKATDGKKVTSR